MPPQRISEQRVDDLDATQGLRLGQDVVWAGEVGRKVWTVGEGWEGRDRRDGVGRVGWEGGVSPASNGTIRFPKRRLSLNRGGKVGWEGAHGQSFHMGGLTCGA